MNYYENNSSEYILKTKNANMKEEYDKFLKYIPKCGSILDLGCGSARDALAFKELGYNVYCLDNVKSFCDIALKGGIDKSNIYNLSILDFNVPIMFDGIWACASLLHLNEEELRNALLIIQNRLKPNGYFYSSFKLGVFKGLRDDRYYQDLTEESFLEYLKATNLELVSSWIQDDKLKRENKWINFIAKLK